MFVNVTREAAAPRRAAFEAIVEEVYEPLQRYLRRRCPPQDVDELLDDVLLVLWRRLDDVPVDGALPWTYGIARRCLGNLRRSGQRRSRLLQRVGAGFREPAGPNATSAADAALHEALDRLPERDREVIRLWAWERLEPREIAEVLGIRPNAVSVRLGRIQRRLADELARHDRAPAGQERHGSREEEGR
jgi:RNA polymerase sigma-70 factor, ECF subfamily